MDESAKGRYNMIMGRDILKSLGFNLKLSEHIIESYNEPLKVSIALMVYLGTYKFKYLNIGKITPEEYFTDSYI